jgi:hypothetical protein
MSQKTVQTEQPPSYLNMKMMKYKKGTMSLFFKNAADPELEWNEVQYGRAWPYGKGRPWTPKVLLGLAMPYTPRQI